MSNHFFKQLDKNFTLDKLPGVGSKLAKKIVSFYGSLETTTEAILDGDIAGLSSIEGISQKTAINIVKTAFASIENISVEGILKTENAVKIHDRILKIIFPFCSTNYAKNKLFLYYPLPPKFLEKIQQRYEKLTIAKKLVEDLKEEDLEKIKKILSKISPLYITRKKKRVEDRVVITEKEESYQEFINKNCSDFCPIYLIGNMDEAIDYAKSFSLVLLISDSLYMDHSLENIPNLEILSTSTDIIDIFPELVLSFYTQKYETINAVCNLNDLLKELNIMPTVENLVGFINPEALETVAEGISYLTLDGDIAEKIDPEIDRYRTALENLDGIISDVEVWANEEISGKIGESSITLKGEQILKLLKEADEMGSLRGIVEEDIVEIIEETVTKAEDKIAEKLELTPSELEIIEGLFSRETAYPLQVNNIRLRELEDTLRRNYTTKKYWLLKKIANQLKELEETTREAVKALLELDVHLAIALFAKEYNLSPPENLYTDTYGISFKNGYNLFLKEAELENGNPVIPIRYKVGNIPKDQEAEVGDERVIILSGANSGGKTTCITLLAQLLIMAQSGLPIPAENAKIGLFDELYYFAKTTGTMDAGALESTLKTFAKVIVEGKGSKIILVDELEAISEPGASAKVIAAILDMLNEKKNSCGVFVSHLAEDIIKFTKNKIRIDGIEATGLDKNLNLIVDRTPKFNYLAKSTPELIVERLSRLSEQTPDHEVYDKILERFKEKENP